MDMFIYMIISPVASAPEIDIRTRALPRMRHPVCDRILLYAPQFFALSTSLLAPIQGIIARSLAPNNSSWRYRHRGFPREPRRGMSPFPDSFVIPLAAAHLSLGGSARNLASARQSLTLTVKR
jgi:hypothetical protein